MLQSESVSHWAPIADLALRDLSSLVFVLVSLSSGESPGSLAPGFDAPALADFIISLKDRVGLSSFFFSCEICSEDLHCTSISESNKPYC